MRRTLRLRDRSKIALLDVAAVVVRRTRIDGMMDGWRERERGGGVERERERERERDGVKERGKERG